MAVLVGAVLVVLLTCLLFLIRLYIVLKSGPNYKPGTKGSVAVLIVAGSGGHTSEILRVMGCLSAAYTPRHYVIADTDRMSEEKICTLENLNRHSDRDPQFTICRIPRSREVHQSWSSSVISTLNALRFSLPLVFRLRPDMWLYSYKNVVNEEQVCWVSPDKCFIVKTSQSLVRYSRFMFFPSWRNFNSPHQVLCNGPGTCVPLCVAGLLLGILGMKKVLIVYVESICRVQTLSLTGKILYPISDYFFVQWASLRDKYPKSIFLGRIV